MEYLFKYLETRDAFVSSVATAICKLLAHPVIIALLHVAIFASPSILFGNEVDDTSDLLVLAGVGAILMAIFSTCLIVQIKAKKGRRKKK